MTVVGLGKRVQIFISEDTGVENSIIGRKKVRRLPIADPTRDHQLRCPSHVELLEQNTQAVPFRSE